MVKSTDGGMPLLLIGIVMVFILAIIIVVELPEDVRSGMGPANITLDELTFSTEPGWSLNDALTIFGIGGLIVVFSASATHGFDGTFIGFDFSWIKRLFNRKKEKKTE